MEPIEDLPQLWWEIVYSYNGKGMHWALAAGSTANEAKANLYRFLSEPEKATILCQTALRKSALGDIMSADEG